MPCQPFLVSFLEGFQGALPLSEMFANEPPLKGSPDQTDVAQLAFVVNRLFWNEERPGREAQVHEETMWS